MGCVSCICRIPTDPISSEHLNNKDVNNSAGQNQTEVQKKRADPVNVSSTSSSSNSESFTRTQSCTKSDLSRLSRTSTKSPKSTTSPRSIRFPSSPSSPRSASSWQDKSQKTNSWYSRLGGFRSQKSKKRDSPGKKKLAEAEIGELNRSSLEKTYSKIVAYSSENQAVTKNSLRKAFDDIMGQRANEIMFDKLFAIFDTDNDGAVNVNEFVIAMAFLLNLDSKKDNIEVAFLLFDSDLDGSIGMQEFNTMINAIFANRLSYVLNTAEGRKLFHQHLETEWSVENIKFYDAVLDCCRRHGTPQELRLLKRSPSVLHEHHHQSPPISSAPNLGADPLVSVKSTIPRAEAEQMYERYIAMNADEQINISASTLQQINDALEEKKSSSDVEMKPFVTAAVEIHELMESDSFQRFKAKLSSSVSLESVDYAQEVWKSLGIPPSSGLSLPDFRSWASSNPGYFKFLEDIQKQLSSLHMHQGDSFKSKLVEPKASTPVCAEEDNKIEEKAKTLRAFRASLGTSQYNGSSIVTSASITTLDVDAIDELAEEDESDDNEIPLVTGLRST